MKKVKCEKCGWEGTEDELEFLWCYQLALEVCPECLNPKDLRAPLTD